MAWGSPATHATETTETGYFQSSWPIIMILGSFFVLTIPLCLLAAGDEDYLFRWSFGLIYICALGMTHFVITLTLYLQEANLRHFWSSRANRITYFGLPLGIFLFFDLYHALGVAAALPLIDVILRYAVRLMDFQHFGRQGYGVLQLFRMRSRCPFPDWMRQAENHHFTALSVLMFITYVSGGVFRSDRSGVGRHARDRGRPLRVEPRRVMRSPGGGEGEGHRCWPPWRISCSRRSRRGLRHTVRPSTRSRWRCTTSNTTC